MRFGLYAGGFLGPFGGAILAVLIPQLRDAFDASTSDVSWAITAYLVPFAALQLVCWLPLYHLEPEAAFVAAALGCVALGAAVLRVRG